MTEADLKRVQTLLANLKRVQTLLANLGFYSGDIDGRNGPLTEKAVRLYQREKGLAVDGKIGPRTWAAMFPEAGAAPLLTLALLKAVAGSTAMCPVLLDPLNAELPKVGVTTPLRIAHFLAQAAEETDGFRTLTEYWGPSKAQISYEGRKSLGNTVAGDGRRFMGRGIFMLTGRANYRQLGAELALDLEAHPELAARPDIAVKLACLYWQTRNINPLADADDVEAVTRRINGGTNGLDTRKLYLRRAKAALGI